MPAGGSIYDDIVKTLEENGEMEDKQYRRLVLLALLDMGRTRDEILEIKKKVERLENNSLILIAKKYPKISLAVLVFALIFIISVIAHLELWMELIEWIKAAV